MTDWMAKAQEVLDRPYETQVQTFARNLEERHKERRERIATAVLAGWVVTSGVSSRMHNHIQNAVAYADALIAELDR